MRKNPAPSTRLRQAALTVGAAALAATTLSAPTAAAPAPASPLDDSSQIRKAVTAKGVQRHLKAFQRIADRNDGTRASGTDGYEASRDYVVKTMRKAGYKTKVQRFDFPFYRQVGAATFERTAPTAAAYVEGTDFSLMTYSGSGQVTGTVQAVDLNLTDLPGSTSGCQDEDFAGFVRGNVALVRRGSCPFGDKVVNAQEAGASAVIVMNTGVEGATDAFAGTLGGPVATVPALGTSFANGQALAAAGTQVRIAATTESEIRPTWNVLAETRKGNKKNVVMAGAHLDSVVEGAGINDNGTGSAALLEAAVQMRKAKPRNKVRFAWWGAEELGLLGSEHYVADLEENDRKTLKKIALYLNFDMVGSPNYGLFVYDGDNSKFEVGPDAAEAPKGSGAIEKLFHDYFKGVGLKSAETEFSGRSDYGAFIDRNIPAGGLFTGAEGVKTEREAKMFGGTAGEAYDECYHAECDDLGNVSRKALHANADAIAHALVTFASSTKSLKDKDSGKKGTGKKRNGGGGLHDHELPAS